MLLQNVKDGFYGGAGGGGKSDWLLMEALQYVDVPSYSALLLRKSYADFILPGALMERAHTWLDDTDAQWNEQNHIWTFPCPNGGSAKLAFGYLEHENDKLRYKSAQFNYVGFDELTDFTETQFRYLFTRVRRSKGFGVPGRVRGASNPGGPGHEWVHLRYIAPDRLPPSRFFIQAFLKDNPHLDVEDYMNSLEEVDAETREQILHGNWAWRPQGIKFKRAWLAGHFLSYRPPLRRAVRFWDLASTAKGKGNRPDWTVGALLGLGEQNQVVIADVRRMQGSPADVEDEIRATAEMDRLALGRGVVIRMEQEPGSSGVNTIEHYRRNVLQGFLFDGLRSSGSKEERFNLFSIQAEHGNVYVVMGAYDLDSYLTELEAFPDPRYKDDQVDATSGGYECLVGRSAGRPGVKVIGSGGGGGWTSAN